MVRGSLLLAPLCTALLVGCTAGTAPDVSIPDLPASAAGPAAGLPELPVDAPVAAEQILARRGSLSTVIEQEGSAAQSRAWSTAVQPDGGLRLNPVNAAPSWAIYRFADLLAADRPNLLTVELSADPAFRPAVLYIGVSNYPRGVWAWQVVTVTEAELVLPLPGPESISPAGNVYVALITMDGPAEVRSLALRLKYGAPPPVDLRAGDGTRKDGIALSWTDPRETYNDDPDFDYELVAVFRAEDPAGPWTEIKRVTSTLQTYLDTEVADSTPGTRYHYRLATVRGGQVGLPGVSDSGYVDHTPQVELEVFQSSLQAPVLGEFHASGFDPDNGTLTHEWEFSDLTVTSTGPESSIEWQFLDSPQGTGTVTVTDDEGQTASDSASVTVKGWARILRAGDDLSPSTVLGDATGGLRLVGYVDNPKPSLMYARYAADGTLQTLQSLGASGKQLYANHAADQAGALLIAGAGTHAADDEFSPLLTRLNADGTLAWAHLVDATYISYFTQVVEDASDGCFALGDLNAGAAALIQRYDAAGALLWSKAWRRASGADGNFHTLAAIAAPGGGLYALLVERDPDSIALLRSAVLLRLDATGSVLWQLTSSDPEFTLSCSLAADAAGIYLVGGRRLLALEHDGSPRWSRWLNMGGPANAQAELVTSDTSDLYLSLARDASKFYLLRLRKDTGALLEDYELSRGGMFDVALTGPAAAVPVLAAWAYKDTHWIPAELTADPSDDPWTPGALVLEEQPVQLTPLTLEQQELQPIAGVNSGAMAIRWGLE